VEVISISRQGEELPGEVPRWLHRERADGLEIDRFLPRVMATITPRRKTPYNDLGVPVKVLEYLGYGRPMIVTDLEETAAIVGEAACGVIVPDSVDGLAAGILEVANASADQRTAWGAAARRAAERNSWDERARQIIEILRERATSSPATRRQGSESELSAGEHLPQGPENDPQVEHEGSPLDVLDV